MSQTPVRERPEEPAVDAAAAESTPAKKSRDVILVHSPTEDQQGVRVIRARDGELEAGEVRPLREGADVQGVEVVTLKERAESPLLWDVDVQYDGRKHGKAHPGPARVPSRAYRQNYDGIFGTKQAEPDVN